MTIDYRTLCAELLAQALELIDISPRDDATIIRHEELFDRARDALAQPEAESSITFKESRGSEVMRVDQRGFHYRGELIENAGLDHRLMVTHRQRHTSMHPEVVEREDTQPEPEGPTDEEIMDLMPQLMHEDLASAARAIAAQAGTDNRNVAGMMRIILNHHAVDLARIVLARWGRPASEPVPEP